MKTHFTKKSSNLVTKQFGTRLLRFQSAICILLIVCMLTLSGFAFQPSNGTPSTNTDINTSVTDTINMYASTDVTYEISRQISLNSFSCSTETYTLYILKPYGYAIFLSNTTCMMEACLQPNARIPVDETFATDYYYGGPGNYYFIENDTYKHATTGQILPQEQVDGLRSTEARVLSSIVSNLEKDTNAGQQQSSRSTETPIQVSEFVARSYFQNLTNFGDNQNGTCAVVACAILLGYYDHYVNDSYVPTQYEAGNGTNDAFHLYLNNLVYGTPTPSDGSIYLQSIRPILNNYLDSRGIVTDLQYATYPSNYEDLANTIIQNIGRGAPVVASMSKTYGASWDHAVVIYGVTYNTDDPAGTAIYTVHMGWWPGSTAGNSYLIRAEWFWDCVYIYCGSNGHAQGLIWNDVDTVFHDITCHCGSYLKERHIAYIDTSTGYCTKCGHRVNHFPEINSTTTEEIN